MTEDEALWTMDDELQPLTIIGTSIADRYEVEKLLGQGGMGSVYLATDQLLDRQVAIKLMKTEVVRRQNPGRFYREARSLARMNHPNIVTLYNCGWYREQAYLMMEYVSGTILSTIIGARDEKTGVKKELAIGEAVSIGIKVAGALSYAHHHGVIHRDIKPGNIVIGEEVKLMDFGIAKIRQDPSITLGGEHVGTPLYMAPEQSLGREVDERTDIYSLGVVLYELLTGRPPFLATDDISLISQHMQVTPVAPNLRNPAIPQRLSNLILRMLAKNPDMRPASADEVLAELESSKHELPDTLSAEMPKQIRVSLVDRARIEALRGIPLFASISAEDLSELSRKLKQRRYPKGQTIFHKDDSGSTLHVIKKGRVRISIPSEDGQDITLAYIGPGDFFGEMSLLDEKPRSATVTAVEDTETLTLERDEFLDFLKWYPDAAICIFGVLTQRLRDLNFHLENIIFYNPPTRLAKTFLNLMKTHGKETPEGWEISIPLTMPELAGMVGVSTPKIRQLLRDLQASSGVVSGKNRRYIILKPEELRKRAGIRW